MANVKATKYDKAIDSFEECAITTRICVEIGQEFYGILICIQTDYSNCITELRLYPHYNCS